MKAKKLFLFAVIAVLAWSFFSCKSTPSLRDGPELSEITINENYSPENEYYIGRAVAVEILKAYNVLDYNRNRVLIDYLNNICTAIVINSPRPEIYTGYRVAVLDTDEINAFATPGGHIFITRGLINAAKSEEALAGVIAHEVAHVLLQHGLNAIDAAERRAQTTGRVTGALAWIGARAIEGAVGGTTIGDIALGIVDIDAVVGVFASAIGNVANDLMKNGYSREQEYDADKIAMALMAASGYNPMGLLDMLNELKAVQRRVSGGFNRTHPTPDQRISNAQQLIGRYPVENTDSYRQARYAAIFGR